MFIIGVVCIIVISIFIGRERAKSNKDLGFRSIALVMLGAYCYTYLSCRNGIVVDWHAIGQIVTGISFVGAGLIFRDKGVHNLTTAILVWTMASIAVLLGMRMIVEAFIASAIVLTILISKQK